ncbi:hypothetical protein PHMEG_00030774 [Phytophthora megakarya]|uniref:Uncharacterized protein n=1 Tax=Phytophthora megakarya TaxID=4795 RepID=A0A225V0A6_9STRA|nr:hypothetical protein PHMEG_00030774 [Phytophthora megakarya]
MTCLNYKRLNGDHGTRVTVIDVNKRVFFEEKVEALAELTTVKRKPYIAQITVWDGKGKPTTAFGGKPYMTFRRGAVYEFRQVDGVGFVFDIAKGSVQYDRGNGDKIIETTEPIGKRKAPCDMTTKNAKAKRQSPSLSSESGVKRKTVSLKS